MLCRTLSIPEPQSVAAASLSLHFADTSASDSTAHFTARDVRHEAGMSCGYMSGVFFFVTCVTFFACTNVHQKGTPRRCTASSI
jgi:hypothetical protein